MQNSPSIYHLPDHGQWWRWENTLSNRHHLAVNFAELNSITRVRTSSVCFKVAQQLSRCCPRCCGPGKPRRRGGGKEGGNVKHRIGLNFFRCKNQLNILDGIAVTHSLAISSDVLVVVVVAALQVATLDVISLTYVQRTGTLSLASSYSADGRA